MTLFTTLFKNKSRFKVIIILIILIIVLVCYLIWADAHHIIKQSIIFIIVAGVLVEAITLIMHHALERVTTNKQTKDIGVTKEYSFMK